MKLRVLVWMTCVTWCLGAVPTCGMGRCGSLVWGGCMFEGMWVVDFLSFVLCVPTVCNWFGLCYRRIFASFVLWV